MSKTLQHTPEFEKALNEYLDNGINYQANTIGYADIEDLKQLSADSFFHGFMYASSVSADLLEENKNYQTRLKEVEDTNDGIKVQARAIQDAVINLQGINECLVEENTRLIEASETKNAEITRLLNDNRKAKELLAEIYNTIDRHDRSISSVNISSSKMLEIVKGMVKSIL